MRKHNGFYDNKAFDKENSKLIKELRDSGMLAEANYYEKFCREWDKAYIQSKEEKKGKCLLGEDEKSERCSGARSNPPQIVYGSIQEACYDPTVDIILAIDAKYGEVKARKGIARPKHKPLIEFESEMPGVTFTDDGVWQAKTVKLVDTECVTDKQQLAFSRSHAEKLVDRFNVDRGFGTRLCELDRGDFEIEWEHPTRTPSKKKIEGGMQRVKGVRKVGDNDKYYKEKINERATYTLLGKRGPLGKNECEKWIKDRGLRW